MTFIPEDQDLHPVEAEIQIRLKDLVPELVRIENGEEFNEEILRRAPAPSAYTLIVDEPSPGPYAHNRSSQVITLQIAVGVVTESFRAKSGAGSYSLRKKVRDALRGWKPASAQRALKLIDGGRFEGRAGPRVCYGQYFETTVHET
jgi:hypothetical protein